MESKKNIHLLTVIFSLLMTEKSMAFQNLVENNVPPENDHSRIRVNGSTPNRDGIWHGNGSDGGLLLVPPPSTKTTMNVWTAVSPTSSASKISVSRSSNTSNTSVTRDPRGGTISRSSSINSTSSTKSSSVNRTSGYP